MPGGTAVSAFRPSLEASSLETPSLGPRGSGRAEARRRPA